MDVCSLHRRLDALLGKAGDKIMGLFTDNRVCALEGCGTWRGGDADMLGRHMAAW